ncbi:tripartite tricarboxylate transporter substrate binding protein [Belnapia sp. F-4-1]|uniref:tripartite tricarboxylate transporter substrate binding protein n=1 Tax=Belnapia sp. F-4-1 TaxID=1545443 RepID=UPI0005B9BFFB|nr:tripartite tricarboxylate transporter substrate binding protein [Belnapia sp. F-4-1]
MRRRHALAALALLARPARAQPGWPARPVRMIVPFPPGQATDLMARLLADQLTPRLGQPCLVDNRSGGAGLPGMEMIAKAPPDGYTLGMASSGPLSINPAVMARLPYDVERDFAPVALVFTTPLVVVVNPNAGIASLPGLVAKARAAPRAIDYASGGPGSSLHLAAEGFCQRAGIQLNHIPYRGSAPAMADLIAGNVGLMFDSLASALPHVQAGRIRALGVTSPARMLQMPDVPTVAEAAGLPGFEMLGWAGLVAPAGTPAPVVGRLAEEVLALVRGEAMAARIAELGATAAPLGPEEFGTYIRSELVKFTAVARAADVRLD